MGAWGIKNFENDDAQDFAYDVMEEGKSKIKDALLKINKSNHSFIDATESQEALAAAEIIAAAKNNPAKDLPEDMKDWLNKNDVLTYKKFLFRKSVNLVQLAEEAIHKILENSELKELWEESGEFEEWKAVQDDIIARLN